MDYSRVRSDPRYSRAHDYIVRQFQDFVPEFNGVNKSNIDRYIFEELKRRDSMQLASIQSIESTDKPLLTNQPRKEQLTTPSRIAAPHQIRQAPTQARAMLSCQNSFQFRAAMNSTLTNHTICSTLGGPSSPVLNFRQNFPSRAETPVIRNQSVTPLSSRSSNTSIHTFDRTRDKDEKSISHLNATSSRLSQQKDLDNSVQLQNESSELETKDYDLQFGFFDYPPDDPTHQMSPQATQDVRKPLQIKGAAKRRRSSPEVEQTLAGSTYFLRAAKRFAGATRDAIGSTLKSASVTHGEQESTEIVTINNDVEVSDIGDNKRIALKIEDKYIGHIIGAKHRNHLALEKEFDCSLIFTPDTEDSTYTWLEYEGKPGDSWVNFNKRLEVIKQSVDYSIRVMSKHNRTAGSE